MARATQPLNLTNFTGGINLRANEFSLADSESPDMMNVEVDPRGGVYTRKGWERWSTADITLLAAWDPRTAFIHERSSGLDTVIVANGDGHLYWSTDGGFAKLTYDALVSEAASDDVHVADFAAWGDTVYFVRGLSSRPAKWDGVSANATRLNGMTTGTDWANDLLAPNEGNMPAAKFIAPHAGYMWVANTFEEGQAHPFRVRWSHPNAPEDWRSQDFIDILDGGGAITGIVPMADHLLVFKQSSVWALYGYDGESQQLVNVSRTVGLNNRKVMARSEDSVYFVSWPQGVHRITNGRLEEVSVALRPAFRSAEWNASLTSDMWLGWLGQRLWWSVPFNEGGIPDGAESVFVFDPSLGDGGSWTMFRGSDGAAVGPFAQGGFGQGSYDLYACARSTPHVMRVEALDSANDEFTGAPVGFASRYTTRWLHAGWPELKKRWKRPTFIAQEQDAAYRLQVSVYADYNETAVKRKFAVNVEPQNGGITYDDGFLYDNSEEYGETPEGSRIRKASAVGSAAAVQVMIEGEVGKKWGLDGVVMKFRQRRFN